MLSTLGDRGRRDDHHRSNDQCAYGQKAPRSAKVARGAVRLPSFGWLTGCFGSSPPPSQLMHRALPPVAAAGRLAGRCSPPMSWRAQEAPRGSTDGKDSSRATGRSLRDVGRRRTRRSAGGRRHVKSGRLCTPAGLSVCSATAAAGLPDSLNDPVVLGSVSSRHRAVWEGRPMVLRQRLAGAAMRRSDRRLSCKRPLRCSRLDGGRR